MRRPSDVYGTIERGESNLSFQNILKVAITLGVSLSVLFQDLEEKANPKPDASMAPKPGGAVGNERAPSKEPWICGNDS